MRTVGQVDPSRVLYSVRDTAKLLAIADRTVYKMLERGELKGVRIGGRRLVRRDELDSFINRLTGVA